MAAMHLHAALDRFLLQLQADGRSSHTADQYKRHVRLLASWLDDQGHSGDAREIDDQDLALFLCSTTAGLRPDGKKKRPGSMNALRASVRGFFRYLDRAGLLDVDPSRLIRRAAAPAPRPRELRAHEEGRLAAVLGAADGPAAERDHMLFELLLGTGIRLTSALALDVEDLDLEEGVIRLRTTKGGGEQRVFLSPQLCQQLSLKLGRRGTGPVFRTARGTRPTSRHMQRRFRQWRLRAGISTAVSPHSLRHAFATRLYQRTRDVLLVRAALGHRAITSTLRYVRVTDDEIRAAVTNNVSPPRA